MVPRSVQRLLLALAAALCCDINLGGLYPCIVLTQRTSAADRSNAGEHMKLLGFHFKH